MLFFDKAHAANTIHTIIKHIPHRSGASDEPHDAPRPVHVQHANLMHIKHTHLRPSRSSQTPDHMPTNAPPLEACLQATAPLHPRRILFSKPPRQLGARPRKEPVNTKRQRQTLFEMARQLYSKRESRRFPWTQRRRFDRRVNLQPCIEQRASAAQRQPKSRHPRDSYHLRCENRSQPENQGH